mgnify:CR=1 FL=1
MAQRAARSTWSDPEARRGDVGVADGAPNELEGGDGLGEELERLVLVRQEVLQEQALRPGIAEGADPLPVFVNDLSVGWPDASSAHEVRWPMYLLVGRV